MSSNNNKLKMKYKTMKEKAVPKITTSEPVNLVDMARLDEDICPSLGLAGTPTTTVSADNGKKIHDSDDFNTVMVRTLEQFKKEFMNEAIADIKDSMKHTIREEFREQYKFSRVEIPDTGNSSYSAYTPSTLVYQRGFSHDSQFRRKSDKDHNKNTDTDSLATEEMNLFADHYYSNVCWEIEKDSNRRDAVCLAKFPSAPSMLAHDSRADLECSSFTPYKHRSESKMPQPSDGQATMTTASAWSGGRQVCADDRECLASAVQSHVVAMVNDVLFTETELPDLLNEQGFLTEEECHTMRKLPNRKDRIRRLLSVIKGRDTRTIQGFLEYLKNDNPEIVEDVYKTYETNKSSGMRCKLCAFCLLKTKVDIKYVVDSVWSIFAIPDGLYNEIIVSQKPAGAKEMTIFWDRLADTCNSHDTHLRTKVFKALIECLTMKNYTHIADKLSSQLQNRNSRLACRCKLVPLRKRVSFISSSATSVSPRSSHSSSCDQLVDNGDVTKPKLSTLSDARSSLESIYEEVESSPNVMPQTLQQDEKSNVPQPTNSPPLPARPPPPPTKPPPLPRKTNSLSVKTNSLSVKTNPLPTKTP